MTTQSSLLQRVQDLQAAIARGAILEAMDEFYADDVVMQDNLEEPCRGKAANVEREKAWLDGVREFTGFEVKAIAASDDATFVESTMDFVTQDGQEVHLEQVSRALWRDGRIVDERFYHP